VHEFSLRSPLLLKQKETRPSSIIAPEVFNTKAIAYSDHHPTTRDLTPLNSCEELSVVSGLHAAHADTLILYDITGNYTSEMFTHLQWIVT